MIADEFSVLGSIVPARDWYAAALAAADRSESMPLQAAVRALAAMLPLYHGRQADVIELSHQARQLAASAPCFATSLASMLEALARARLGDHGRARLTLRSAQTAHDNMDESDRAESFFGFSLRRRLFYEGRLLTLIGDYAGSEAAHQQARQLYPPQVVGDPAIMDFDRALALVNTNEIDAGVDLIGTTLSQLPVDHQRGIFLSIATRAFDAIPVTARRLPAARTCAELLDEMSATR